MFSGILPIREMGCISREKRITPKPKCTPEKPKAVKKPGRYRIRAKPAA
jgi:hypothetical protein